MGFHFNHVGNGCTTRCPVQLRMVYDAGKQDPHFMLYTESNCMQAVPKSFDEVKQHITEQNKVLEHKHEFSDKHIILQVRYKGCPNLVVVDTPGMVY